MTRTLIALTAAFAAGAAAAHPGHIAPEAGHGHAEFIALAFVIAFGAYRLFARR